MRAFTGLILFAVSAPVWADATLSYRHEHDASPAMTVAIAGGKLRMDVNAGSAVVVDPGTRKVVVLDTASRRYTELDPATVAALGGQLAAVREQMQAAMEGMTPEQRAQMEAMMGGAAGDLLNDQAPAPATFERTGTSQRHGDFSCEVARLRAPDGSGGELCIAPARDVGLGDAERATLEAAFNFARELAEPLRAQGLDSWFELQPPAGYVLVRSAMEGEPAQMLDEVDPGAVDPAHFAVPEGYTRQALPAP